MSAPGDDELAPLVATRNVVREFGRMTMRVMALRGIDLEIYPGEMVALQGRSGSGKTTLLNVLVGLDSPTEGQVILFGRSLATMPEQERVRLRRERIGVLFQNAHLLPSLTAQENIEIALRLLRVAGKERLRRSREALEMVGLTDRARHRALELSGGEQQRVALARALVHHPQLIIADEPTGALDVRTGQAMARLLTEVAHQHSIGILVATHDPMVVRHADRTLHIRDGKVVSVAP